MAFERFHLFRQFLLLGLQTAFHFLDVFRGRQTFRYNAPVYQESSDFPVVLHMFIGDAGF